MTAKRTAKRTAVKKRPPTKKTGAAKKRAKKPAAASKARVTTAERFVTGQYTEADLAPVRIACPECGHRGFEPVKGRFGPVWRCLNRPACKHFFDSRPTGRKCGHVTRGKKCGAPMVEGTKTIPDRCSLRSCPNRNPHKL